tara:strand:+ start:172 stop:792 length:621 start_codon:yes stop_codon:yes gene_type:complete
MLGGGSAAGFGGMVGAGGGILPPSGGMGGQGQFSMYPMAQHFQQQQLQQQQQPPVQMHPGMYMQQQPHGNVQYTAAYQGMCNQYQQQQPHLGQGQQRHFSDNGPGQLQQHFSGNGQHQLYYHQRHNGQQQQHAQQHTQQHDQQHDQQHAQQRQQQQQESQNDDAGNGGEVHSSSPFPVLPNDHYSRYIPHDANEHLDDDDTGYGEY